MRERGKNQPNQMECDKKNYVLCEFCIALEADDNNGDNTNNNIRNNTRRIYPIRWKKIIQINYSIQTIMANVAAFFPSSSYFVVVRVRVQFDCV